MTTATIDVTGSFELTYDENSPEFKEAFSDFKACIDKEGTIESMLKHVAHNIIRFGDDRMVEGVGYVGYNGRIPEKENYSGIMIGSGYDDFDYDVITL